MKNLKKQSIEDLLRTEYVKVVRRDGKLVDYVLEGEPVKPHEIVGSVAKF